MKRVLVYAYLAGNLGDDLLVTILCRRYPKVEFHMLAEERYKQRFAALSNAVIHTPGDTLVQEKGQWMEKHRHQKRGKSKFFHYSFSTKHVILIFTEFPASPDVPVYCTTIL